jgi:hypothetical protein
MRYLLPLLILFASAACSEQGAKADIHRMPIKGLALNDMNVLGELGASLTAKERAALATYSIAHWPDAPAFCGEVLLGPAGEAPMTIGEAIAFTLEREKVRARRLAEASAPQTRVEELLSEKRFIEGQQEQLFAQIELLESAHGDNAQTLPAWTAIEKELDHGYAKIAKLNADIGNSMPADTQ